jgi:hypothetical protein
MVLLINFACIHILDPSGWFPPDPLLPIPAFAIESFHFLPLIDRNGKKAAYRLPRYGSWEQVSGYVSRLLGQGTAFELLI